MDFEELALIEPLLRAVAEEGYVEATPIQAQAIPPILAGRDVMGCARTGTGKTAAFALPILQHLFDCPAEGRKRPIRSLVLSPTRELAAQIGESFSVYGRFTKVRAVTMFGGVSQVPQVEALRGGVDVLVATPGRLLDLIQQGHVSLDRIEVFVLDEADRMLDMGFIPDIRRIARMLPRKRQTLFFSATLPDNIVSLAESLVSDPVSVAVDPPASTVDLIEQGVCFVEKEQKVDLLLTFLRNRSLDRVLVFSRTKHGADKIVRKLKQGGVHSLSLHGDKSQNARTNALEQFKSGVARVLVATDIASRGLDVDDVSLVVNFDVPVEPEVYVHRIGRTGRAGAQGMAVLFCALDERAGLIAVERLIGRNLMRMEGHPFQSHYPLPLPTDLKKGKGAVPFERPKRDAFGAPVRTGRVRSFRSRRRP